jgi:hypothetical protein
LAFLTSTPENYQYSAGSTSTPPTTHDVELSQTHKVETRWRVAAQRQSELLEEIVTMEVKMGIDNHWQPSDSRYIDTLKYMADCKYHQALDHLQKLVIQRLFELNRLNLAGTGK